MKPDEKKVNLLLKIDITRQKIRICNENARKHPSLGQQMYDLIKVYEKQIEVFSNSIAKLDCATK